MRWPEVSIESLTLKMRLICFVCNVQVRFDHIWLTMAWQHEQTDPQLVFFQLSPAPFQTSEKSTEKEQVRKSLK